LVTAKAKKVEKGRKVRIDCTCVESNIHHPTDSTLLWDAVRVLTRLMEQCRHAGVKIPGFHNHSRVAKRRMLAIVNAKRKISAKRPMPTFSKPRPRSGYAKRAIGVINAMPGADLRVVAMSCQIEHYVQLTEKVINQTVRRVMRGEKVDAATRWYPSLNRIPTLSKKTTVIPITVTKSV
jgi:IS5 family transposase